MAPLPKPALSPTLTASAPFLAPDPPPTPRPAFPIAALGPRLGAAVAAIAARTQGPVPLAAHHLLTLAALAAQRLAAVRLPTGALRPISCYFVTLVGTGEGRGALAEAVVEPARRVCESAPLQRQRLFFDTPAPSGSDRYRTFRHQSALFAERSEAVIASARTRRAEAASLAGLWDGRVEHTSVLTGPIHPRLSLHFVATPRDGGGVLGDPLLADGGLLGRLLVAAPPSCIGERVWSARNDDAPPELAAFHDHLKTLLAADATVHSRALAFTGSAAVTWFDFAQEMEDGMREGQSYAAIRPLAGRLAEHAARLAAIIELIEDEAVTEIDETALARGLDLARFYAAEAFRLHVAAPILESIPDAADQLQRWLERTHDGRSVTLREVCRSGPACSRDADVAYRLMRRLERLGVIQPKSASTQPPGQPRRVREPYCWTVRPLASTPHAGMSQDVA
ncbi:MAG: DUF3987 domain-containing protein [Rhodospirillaceae bacterium]